VRFLVFTDEDSACMRDNRESNDRPLFLWPYARVPGSQLGPVLANPQVPSTPVEDAAGSPGGAGGQSHTSLQYTNCGPKTSRGRGSSLHCWLRPAGPAAAKMRHGDRDRQRAEPCQNLRLLGQRPPNNCSRARHGAQARVVGTRGR
jgi:hypothetical protein